MSRISGDEIRDGRVFNGFDYELQVWVRDGIITDVGLGADKYARRSIFEIPEAEQAWRREG
jgi:hypothetical protein